MTRPGTATVRAMTVLLTHFFKPAALGRWAGRCHARWRQRQHLARLDDRALADVGLTKADVRREMGLL